MSHKLRILILIILIALVIFSTAFIFMNSLMDYEHSHNSSGVITDIITSTDDIKERDHTDMVVRKLAHIIEYALLGACVSALCIFIGYFYKKYLYGYFIAYSLFIATLDEHCQSFSDRVSSTSDILLDFFGSLLGGVFAILIYFTVIYFLKRKNNARH